MVPLTHCYFLKSMCLISISLRLYLLQLLFSNFIASTIFLIFFITYNYLNMSSLYVFNHFYYHYFTNVWVYFCRSYVKKYLAKITVKHLCRSLFFFPATLFKKDSSTGAFLWILLNFWEQLFTTFLRTTLPGSYFRIKLRQERQALPDDKRSLYKEDAVTLR